MSEGACRWLRWKGWREDRLSGRSVAEIAEQNVVPYSCLRTCQPGGPDGRLASAASCGEHRGCFERDALLRVT
jgi:hypothetical protein